MILRIVKNTGSFVFLLAWLLNIGSVMGQGVPDASSYMQNARKTEEQALAQKDQKLLAEAYYLYGRAYIVVGDFSMAHDYFIRSLSILEPLGDSYEVGRLYLCLADNEGHRRQHRKAIEYALEGEKVFSKTGSDDGLIQIYNMLGRLHIDLLSRATDETGDLFNSSLRFYNKAEEIALKIKDTAGLAEVHLDLGLLRHRGKKGDPLPHLIISRDLNRALGRKDHELAALMRMVDVYSHRRQFKEAKEVLAEAVDLYNSVPIPTYNMNQEFEFYSMFYYTRTGEWEQAYKTLVRIRHIETEKLAANSDSVISRLNAEFETQKKEAELAAQRTELDLNQRNLKLQTGFIVALLVLFAGAIGTGIVFFRLYRKNRRISAINASLVKEQNHRVKNNLQVMASMLHLQSRQLPDESARQALSDSRLRVQYMAMVQQKLYEEEYLAGMNLRVFIPELADMVLAACGYPDIDTEFDIEKIYLIADQAIPVGMIVNELITNSCKYAFPYREKPILKIECTIVKEGRLHLVIADNGRAEEEPYTGSPERGNRLTAAADIAGRNSFGMELIRMQARQLDADWQFSHPNPDPASGLIFTMEFKITNA